jgi:hypothetical protein
MPAFRVLPFDVLIRAADPAAAALMAAFIADVHADFLPFVYLGWTEDGAIFFRALRCTNVMIKYGQMGFRIRPEANQVLLFLN